MNQDKSLKDNEKKLIFLICGNSGVGKKTFVNNILNKLNLHEAMIPENKSFYIVYNFKLKRKIDDHTITIPIEIRILNSDERDSELKSNSSFYKGAYGAFVIIDNDVKNLQDCSKWKENIDLMCCLPNKFPLPIFLIVNKKLKIEDENLSIGMDDINEITDNNLFFKSYIVKAKSDTRISTGEDVCERPSKLSTYIKDDELPFNDMIELILKFKDIREKIISAYLKCKNQKGSRRFSDDNNSGIRNQDKKSCSIL